MTLYGIRNCDTVRAARAWLDAHGLDYRFHDHRADGVEAARVAAWIAEHGWEPLVNRRGTTWRALPADARAPLDAARAAALMQAHPALIRRPLLDLGTRTIVGFSADAYAAALLPPA